MSLTLSHKDAEHSPASWAEAARLLDTIISLINRLPVEQKEQCHWEQLRPKAVETLALLVDHAIAEEPPDGQD